MRVEKNIFLVSSEESTEVCPIACLSYGILLLPLIILLKLIIQLKLEFPQVKSPWYADDGAAAGTLDQVLTSVEVL